METPSLSNNGEYVTNAPIDGMMVNKTIIIKIKRGVPPVMEFFIGNPIDRVNLPE